MEEAKILADGQLPSSQEDIYVCSVVKAKVEVIRLVNIKASQITLNIYVCKFNCAPRRIFPKDFVLPASHSAIDDTPIRLSNGDTIRGYASMKKAVDYVITGVEES